MSRIRTPEEAALNGEMRRELERMLAELPKIDRSIVIAKCVNGEAYGVMARSHGIEAGHVAVRLHRALRRLRAGLQGMVSAP